MFSLNDNQTYALKVWKSKQEEEYCGAVGGRYTYEFTPTTIGIDVKVIDNVSKDSIDLTNYEDW